METSYWTVLEMHYISISTRTHNMYERQKYQFVEWSRIDLTVIHVVPSANIMDDNIDFRCPLILVFVIILLNSYTN